MMGDDGGSRSKESVAAFAKEHGIPMIDGDTVIAEWEKFIARTGMEV